MTAFSLPGGGTPFTGPAAVFGGTAANPGLQFGSVYVGLYSTGAGSLSVSMAGTSVADFGTAGVTIPGTLSVTGAISLRSV